MRRMTLARRKGLRSGALSAVIVWAAACSLALHAGRSPAQDWHLPALDGSPSFALSREVVPVPASAQSLLELTDIALRNNPRTRLAWATVRSRAAALGVARAAYWPQLDATLSASYSRTNSSSTGMPGNDLTRYGPAISLSYLLWDFGARASEAAAGEAELLGARLVLDQTLQDVILEVEQRYYQTQGLSALVRANEKSLASAQASVDAARQRQQSDLSTVGDVYRAEASLAEVELALQQARGALASARGALASAVGFAPNTELALQPWSAPDTAWMPARTVEQVLAQARRARPELLAAKARERAAQARVRQAMSARRPTISLNAEVGRNHVVDHGTTTNYSVGANLEVPLFAGFRYRHERERAEAEVAQAQAETEILLHQVETEVWQAYQDVLTAEKMLDRSEALLKSAQRAEQAARSRYEVGLDTIVELLTVQETLAAARASRVQARMDYFSALAALGHAAGGLAHSSAPAADEP